MLSTLGVSSFNCKIIAKDFEPHVVCVFNLLTMSSHLRLTSGWQARRILTHSMEEKIWEH